MAAAHKPDTKQILQFFFFFSILFCATSVELIEKVNAFSSVSTPATIQDSFGSSLGSNGAEGRRGDIPLKRKVQQGASNTQR